MTHADIRRHRIGCQSVAICLLSMLTSVWLVIAHAQQPAKMPRIGYVRVVGTPSTPGPNVEAFRQGLRDLGYA